VSGCRRRRFLPGEPFLSPRAQVASTLGAVLTLDQPRAAFPTEGLPGRLEIGRDARVEQRQERGKDRRERRDDRGERRDDRRAPTPDDEDGGFRAWIAGLRRGERDG
jgi:hypothetical protein